MTLDIKLVGTTTKMATVSLRPGQVVYSEAGKFLFSSGDVVMETRMSAPSSPASLAQNGGGQVGGSGGLGGLLRGTMDAGKRVLAGESFDCLVALLPGVGESGGVVDLHVVAGVLATMEGIVCPE